MQQNTKVEEINNFLKTTHKDNLDMLRAKLFYAKWHWMFPEHWVNNESNRLVIYHAINSFLLPRPENGGGKK